MFSRNTQQPSLIYWVNNQILSTGTNHSLAGTSAAGTPAAAAPALRFLRAEKQKLVYLLVSTLRLSPSQLLYITIFATKKAKTAKDVLARKALATARSAAGTPAAAAPRSDFYKQKSKDPPR